MCFIIFFIYIKIATNYYQKYKEKLRKKDRKRYQNLSEEEKDKRQKKVWERPQNLREEQKQKLPEYMKSYYLVYHLLFSI